MRSLYREVKYECGDYLEVDVFPVYEYQHGRSRRRKPTTETQERLNRRNAERKLIRLLNTNFTDEDIRFDLTYETEPAGLDAALNELRNFFRRLKRYRQKTGLEELKYVAVTEMGSKNGRIHHHIVMNGGVSINKLAKIWGKGYTTAKPLQFDEQEGIAALAHYLLKNKNTYKSWSASKNLKQPKVSKRDGKLSHRTVEEWNRFGRDCKYQIEQVYDGYYLADISPYQNEVNGGIYLTIRLFKQRC